MLFKPCLLAAAATLAAGAAYAQPGPAVRATDGDAITSIGATVKQVRDADLVNPAGLELGEVEAVLLDDSGQLSLILVELEDDVFQRERLVLIELADLTAREDDSLFDVWDDEIDLVTEESLEALEALPEWGGAQ